MQNPNVRIVLIAVVLIAAVAVAGVFMAGGVNTAEETEQTAQGVQAYLRVQVGDQVWEPIALADGEKYTITQPTGEENVVQTTATGIVMHFSTCDNQSCIKQGEVTLDNRDSRVLTNMIICLPNQVILELLTPEEAGMEAAQ